MLTTPPFHTRNLALRRKPISHLRHKRENKTNKNRKNDFADHLL